MATKKKNNTAPAKGKKNAAAKAEPAKAAPAKAADTPKPKLSLLKAAVAVLEGSDEALNTKQMIEQAKAKGENSRFKLVTKGHFKLASR